GERGTNVETRRQEARPNRQQGGREVPDDGEYTMSQPGLRAGLAVGRRPAGPDLSLSPMPDEAADGTGGGGGLGMDRPHEAPASSRGGELGIAGQPGGDSGPSGRGRGWGSG